MLQSASWSSAYRSCLARHRKAGEVLSLISKCSLVQPICPLETRRAAGIQERIEFAVHKVLSGSVMKHLVYSRSMNGGVVGMHIEVTEWHDPNLIAANGHHYNFQFCMHLMTRAGLGLPFWGILTICSLTCSQPAARPRLTSRSFPQRTPPRSSLATAL